jgi:hypothetical protein
MLAGRGEAGGQSVRGEPVRWLLDEPGEQVLVALVQPVLNDPAGQVAELSLRGL